MKPLSKAALATVRDALAPGGTVSRVRPLRGGLSCSVDSVRLVSDDGSASNVVVRRYGTDWLARDPAVCEREFKLLGIFAEHDFPAPRPLLHSEDRSTFEGPTVVMTRLAGRGLLAPRRLEAYLEQLADVLGQLHRIPTDPLRFLPVKPPAVDRGPASADPLEAEVWRALRALWPRVRPAPECLLHGDYWPGNVVFSHERLSGVVDWEMAHLGDPARDVATCRGDLSVLFSTDAADAFTQRYQRAQGEPLDNLAFWDIYTVSVAMRYMREWAAGYRALGRTDLDGAAAQARLEDYARALLAEVEHGRGQ